MIYYFEFRERMVERGEVPAKLCFVIGMEHDSRIFGILEMAERAYIIEGNNAIEIKNRYKRPGVAFISDEDKVVLKLKAMLL